MNTASNIINIEPVLQWITLNYKNDIDTNLKNLISNISQTKRDVHDYLFTKIDQTFLQVLKVLLVW